MAGPTAHQQTDRRFTGRTHGTPSCYRDGCRCDVCRDSAAERGRARRGTAESPVDYELPHLGLLVVDDGDWRDYAACHGKTDTFFVDVGTTAEAAREICAGCPVRAKCLDYALDHKEHYGVWGGLTPIELARVRRRRARAAS